MTLKQLLRELESLLLDSNQLNTVEIISENEIAVETQDGTEFFVKIEEA